MTALLGEVERTQEGTLLGFGLVLHGDQLLLIDGSTSLSTSVPFNQWVHASGRISSSSGSIRFQFANCLWRQEFVIGTTRSLHSS